jgi:protein involved in sex pheromone biosynthesis
MPTRASTSLNRILRVTANLLFEKGESVQAISNLMQGFVDRRMIQDWYEKYCQVNGLATDVNSEYKKLTRKIPVAPIDFKAVTLDNLKSKIDEEFFDL